MAGFWLFTIPALFAGVIEVLVPLRMDDLGASGAAIGAVFLVAAAVEAVISPLAGRWSDRAGRLAPIRAGLIGGGRHGGPAAAAGERRGCSPWPSCSPSRALAVFWAPGMAMLSDAAEDAGLDQALAFSLSNLAWAVGHIVGAGGGGAVAEATCRRGALRRARRGLRRDAFVGLTANRRRQAAPRLA